MKSRDMVITAISIAWAIGTISMAAIVLERKTDSPGTIVPLVLQTPVQGSLATPQPKTVGSRTNSVETPVLMVWLDSATGEMKSRILSDSELPSTAR